MKHQILFLSVGLALITSIVLAAPKTRELPRRPFFGASTAPIPDSLRGTAGNPALGGAKVVRLFSGSSAAKAGIVEGDVLVSMDNQILESPQDLTQRIAAHRAGETVKIAVLHEAKLREVPVKLLPYPKENPGDFDVAYEAIDVEGALRRLVITRPRLPGRLPVVVMLGGLGCYSLDQLSEIPMPYRNVLYALTRAGFVTVRVEKTGQGDSQGPPCATQTMREEVHGLVTAIQTLSQFSYMDTSRVILLGHSMGGVEAPLVANQVHVKGICAIATSAIGWIEYELINQRRQLVLQGMDYDSIEISAAEKERAAHMLFVEKKSPDDIIRADSALAQYVAYPADYRYMQEVASLNLAHEWKTVDAPVLFIYGTSDFVTAAAEHEYGRDLINRYHPGRAEYVEVPNMDHFFIKVPSQQASFDNIMAGQPNREFSDQVLPVITDWARKIAAQ